MAGVTRRFGQQEPVVDGVSLAVSASRILGLVGPNGGGKSTLLALMAGLLLPDEGQVRLDGVPVDDPSVRARGRIGLVTARPGLYPALTVRENLAWFAGLHGIFSLQDALTGPVATLGLTAHLDQPVSQLSSGQQQKTSLVRALLTAPSVLLFDEPTANLDPESARVLEDHIRTLAEAGTAVVLCSHDLHLVERLCDEVIAIHGTATPPLRLSGAKTPSPAGAVHTLFASVLRPSHPVPVRHTPLPRRPPVLHLAWREMLEQRRHPLVLGIALALTGLIAGLTLSALGMLALIGSPEQLDTLASVTGQDPTTVRDDAIRFVLTAHNFLIASQYLGFVGVIAGHSLLHDRQLGTLPFLQLAPIGPRTLLAGKVLGAWFPVTLLTVLVGAASGVGAYTLTTAAPALAAGTLAWWLALVVALPVWGLFLATLAAITSSVATDVRLAQQAVWFTVFFVQLAVAFLVTGALHSLAAQGVAVALGATCTLVAGWFGATVVDRA